MVHLELFERPWVSYPELLQTRIKKNGEKLHLFTNLAFLKLPLNNRILKCLLRIWQWLASVSDRLTLVVSLPFTGFRVGTLIQFSNGFGLLVHEVLTFWHRTFTFNSNKSPTWCNKFSVYYPDVCLQLNMFRAFSRPSSGAQWRQWQPLVLPSYRGDSRAVFVVGPPGRTTHTARLSPRYEGKTRGCHCRHWAPDDGRENAPNMLSCKQTSG
jgi:hypothetical protein